MNRPQVKKASEIEPLQAKQVATDLCALNDWLGGCIQWGQCVEWGLPRGHELRPLILSFFRPSKGLALWVYNPEEKRPYPSSWAARQVDLQRIYFTGSSKPIEQIRPVFMQNLFQVIVVDSPEHLSSGDFSFLATRARLQRQLIFVLRPFLLSAKRGNPFTPLRINALLDQSTQSYRLWCVRGPVTQPLHMARQALNRVTL